MNLYIIQNRVAKQRVTEPIAAQSDLVALLGFVQYVKGQKEQNDIDKRMFALFRCGYVDEDGCIHASDETFERICVGDDAESLYAERLQEAFDREEAAMIE